MDPVLELSTLSASYLWALRDIFPDAKCVGALNVAGLTTRVCGPGPGGNQRTEPRSVDFALCAQLQALALRQNGDAWSHEPQPPAKTQAPKSREQIVAELKSTYERWNTASDLAGYCQRARSSLDHFTDQAHTLVALFHDIGLENKVTEERLTRQIQHRLLQDNTLRCRLARTLDYVPVLLRALQHDRDLPARHTAWKTLLDDPSYPCKLVEACRDAKLAIPFPLVLHKELDEIYHRRARVARDRSAAPCDIPLTTSARAPVLERALHSDLVGLALSGGGIRSATFNLGVLQGLARKNWLTRIDYLSTVSGGGYIGAWLIAWIKRRGSVALVQESLGGHSLPSPVGVQTDGHGTPPAQYGDVDPAAEHVRPIRWLREFSNYLTPQVGAFSADSWTMIAIWLRNTVLNLLMLTMSLMAVLLLPRLAGGVYFYGDITWCLTGTALFLTFASLLGGFNLRTFTPGDDASDRGDTPFVVVISIVVPLMFVAVLAAQATWFAGYARHSAWHVFWWSFGLLSGGLVLTACVSGEGRTRHATKSKMERWKTALKRGAPWTIGASVFAGVGGATLVVAVYKLLVPALLLETRRGIWLDLAFGPLITLLVLGFTITLYLGLEGLALHDERREWWSRLGAWLGLFGGGWALVATISYFSPYIVAAIASGKAGVISVIWTGLTALGIWLAQSGKSNGINLPFDQKVITSAVIKASPFVFIAGYLVLVAMFTHGLLLLLPRAFEFSQSHTVLDPLPFALARYVDTYWAFMDPRPAGPLLLIVGLFALAFIIASRVDVNEFSMHHFYKNRLVRAFLGASRLRADRRPNAFTGLDMQDDIKLARFRHDDQSTPTDEWTNCRTGYTGPYPIINTTLNITAGDELGWQERKGLPFVLTPLYCGYDFVGSDTADDAAAAQFGYRPTEHFAAGDEDGPKGPLSEVWRGRTHDDCGVSLGTAIAISGAAANPNAGYHTSPGVAFLLTIFNARLGWWMGNTRLASWRRLSPPIGLFYLLSELFGFSGVDRTFVQLSDGGHFDNMGLYELVRRRCRFIIVCDAEQDDHYSLNGLGGAIRKCRIDFGAIIRLDTTRIRKQKRGTTEAHIAFGTISYPEDDMPGRIVYLKASLTGDEPVDVAEYRARHREFPHQTTGDQCFDESQFESYRALGQHIVDCGFPERAQHPAGQNDRGQLEALLREPAVPADSAGYEVEA